MSEKPKTLEASLADRFGEDAPCAPANLADHAGLAAMARRGSVRSFRDQPVPVDVIETLAAVALAAPTKSDLQQRDIVHVRDPQSVSRLKALLGDQAWIAGAPTLLVFCANHRRQQSLHEFRGHTFANEHIDAVINAAGDAAIALAAFVSAAETIGLGCCPISAVRNEPDAVSTLLGLPELVFPFAGLAVGYPQMPPEIAFRAPFRATFHVDTFDDTDWPEQCAAYDARRGRHQPYAAQRRPDLFGAADAYSWSEDKARQYALQERAGFGAFLRRRGFRTD